MPKYNVRVEFEFDDVEAVSKEVAEELCYDAIGNVICDHPTTGAEVYSLVDTNEVED